MRIHTKLISPILFISMTLGANGLYRGLSQTPDVGLHPLAFKPLMETSGFAVDDIHFSRGEYIIIVHDALLAYIPDFVQFKKSQGFDVTVAPLSVTGNTPESIKSYIANALNANPMLEYVLLIGDVDGLGELPSFYYGPENDVTDQKYTHLVGDDSVPDVFIGRFSVDSPVELLVSIQKTIQYHRNPLAHGDWLDRGLVVGGNYSNTVPIPITPVWTSRWVRDILLDEGYAQVDTVFYPPIQYGAPQIQSILNNGVGIVNYRGWGDANGWHYPEFHVNDVGGLNNGWMTPVFTSFVCNANDFANNVDPCLGESIVRAGSPSVPKGGVAVIGPSDLHTSTKYNNIINAYMFDAILDHNVLELAPAMLAGQLGLLREFPDQDGAGEAQEFYFHVYNILGDPSLNIHVKSPDVFTLFETGSDIDAGFIKIHATNSSGNPVPQAVVAIMSGDDLIGKGMTDIDGGFSFNIPAVSGESISVYVNKPGFVQGMIDMTPASVGIVFSGYSFDGTEESHDPIPLGTNVDIYPVILNSSGSSLGSGTGTVTADGDIVIVSDSFTFNSISDGESAIATSPVTVRIEDHLFTNYANLNVDLSSGSSGMIGVPVETPPFEITLESATTVEPNVSFSPRLSLINHGGIDYGNVTVSLAAISEETSVSLSGNEPAISIDSWGTVESNLSDYTVTLGDMSWGSTVTIQMDLKIDNHVIYSKNQHLAVLPPSHDLPAMPSQYGYWVYDNTDDGYTEKPTFDWVELDPDYGGANGTHYPVDDDDHVTISLPFAFTYFGEDYSSITLSSNGWVSLIPCNIDYFWNYTIPMALGPKALMAVFWDDLEVVGTDSINIFTWHDETNGRFVIEWSRALNNFDEVTEETFELILYDPTVMVTSTGDGVIEMQYLDINNVDSEKNYATIGIEDHHKNDGIQVSFNNIYAPGVAPLENGRIYRFTPHAPVNYVPPLSVDYDAMPEKFGIQSIYPNPFNPTTKIEYTVEHDSRIVISIYDIKGRHVTTIVNQHQSPGTHVVNWNGTSIQGIPMASGTYFVVLENGIHRKTEKLLLLR